MGDIARIYPKFDPVRPLEAHETSLYVDWQKTCLPDDVKLQLARAVAHAGPVPVQRLFTGHRGIGKTTELNRVRQRLEEKHGFFVSMLQAEEFVDLGDVQPPDLVLQMARQLLQDFRDAGFGTGWLKFETFFGEIAEAVKSDASLERLEAGVGPLKFGIAIKQVPGARARLRKILEDRLPSIYDLINQQILGPARDWLREQDKRGPVLIVDQLDRIPQKVLNEQGLTNQKSLFLDNAGTLRALDCHTICTIPIELAYSRERNALRNVYGCEIESMPVIPVRRRDGGWFEPGVKALRQIVENRAGGTRLFENDELLGRYIRLSGGHVRSLFTLIRSSLDRTDELPIDGDVARRTIARVAADLALPLRDADRRVLENVHRTHAQQEEDSFYGLLKDQYVYSYLDEKGYWYDWNPLLNPDG
jgi:hypothetical protein